MLQIGARGASRAHHQRLTNHKWCLVIPTRPGTCSFHAAHSWLTTQVTPLRKQLKDEKRARKAKNLLIDRDGAVNKAIRLSDWELTVGIEIHAQLNTSRKLFSVASSSSNDEPNTRLAPFDLSVPGSQPVFQKATLIPAIRAAIALSCTVQHVSRFDRKHYFYHDQPAGYQITQYYAPFAKDGHVKLSDGEGNGEGTVVGIKQVQMEQDTAKTQDRDATTSLIDFNRAGIPLIEIISLPQIHSPEVASAYVRKVQALLLSVNAVTTGMEMGGLRADVNVSVRRRNAEPGAHEYGGIRGLGQRTEIKNLSTLKGVEDAIKAERDRQIAVLETGGTIIGETRGWSLSNPTETRRLRGKEGEVDYRYMPDPDIPPLYISHGVVEYIAETLPPVPDLLLSMLVNKYGLGETDARIMLSLDNGERFEYFQDVFDHLQALQGSCKTNATRLKPNLAKTASNWVLHELGSLLSISETPWSANKVTATHLATIINMLLRQNLTTSTAKEALRLVFDGDGRSVRELVEEENLSFRPLSDEEYTSLAMSVIRAHPQQANEFREKGKQGKLMFLVGQMMRSADAGALEAKRAEGVLREVLRELNTKST